MGEWIHQVSRRSPLLVRDGQRIFTSTCIIHSHGGQHCPPEATTTRSSYHPVHTGHDPRNNKAFIDNLPTTTKAEPELESFSEMQGLMLPGPSKFKASRKGLLSPKPFPCIGPCGPQGYNETWGAWHQKGRRLDSWGCFA